MTTHEEDPFAFSPNAQAPITHEDIQELPDGMELLKSLAENEKKKPKRKASPDHTQRVIDWLTKESGGLWWRVDGWQKIGMRWQRKDMHGLWDVMGLRESHKSYSVPWFIQIIDPTGRAKHLRKMVDDVEVIGGKTRLGWLRALAGKKMYLCTVEKVNGRYTYKLEEITPELIQKVLATPKGGRLKV